MWNRISSPVRSSLTHVKNNAQCSFRLLCRIEKKAYSYCGVLIRKRVTQIVHNKKHRISFIIAHDLVLLLSIIK